MDTTNTTTTSTTTTTCCFLVQKCSFVEGGWQRHYDTNDSNGNADPTDYLALFTTQQYAQLVAFKSAQVYAQHHHAVVRTLSLPTHSHHAHHADAPSSLPNYAYTVAGKLFWVRRVLVQGRLEEEDDNNNDSSSQEAKGAQCILTNGVIGFGMTRCNSNNGTSGSPEVETDCAFVGRDAQKRALQTMVARRQQPPVSVVWWLPIGGISGTGTGSDHNNNDNNSLLMQGWNQADYLVSLNHSNNNNNNENSMMDDNQHQHDHHHQEMMAATLASVENASKRHHEMQHGAPPRPSKRFCRHQSSSTSLSSSSSSLGQQQHINHNHMLFAAQQHHHQQQQHNMNSSHHSGTFITTTTHPGTGEEQQQVVDLHRSYMM